MVDVVQFRDNLALENAHGAQEAHATLQRASQDRLVLDALLTALPTQQDLT